MVLATPQSIKIYTSLVESLIWYRCEAWTVTARMHNALNAKEMSFWRRYMHKTILNRVPNTVIREIADAMLYNRRPNRWTEIIKVWMCPAHEWTNGSQRKHLTGSLLEGRKEADLMIVGSDRFQELWLC